ncbi:unnamed protein product [Prorocentrum cordatum]|uniref:Secreted protein n=1 Tax=Prorocentrum cordatum TaxID=2364126 RepID=A0ABN9SF05_9DINO|nr:unnamed protein product [Polarella glacialis]
MRVAAARPPLRGGAASRLLRLCAATVLVAQAGSLSLLPDMCPKPVEGSKPAYHSGCVARPTVRAQRTALWHLSPGDAPRSPLARACVRRAQAGPATGSARR